MVLIQKSRNRLVNHSKIWHVLIIKFVGSINPRTTAKWSLFGHSLNTKSRRILCKCLIT